MLPTFIQELASAKAKKDNAPVEVYTTKEGYCITVKGLIPAYYADQQLHLLAEFTALGDLVETETHTDSN